MKNTFRKTPSVYNLEAFGQSMTSAKHILNFSPKSSKLKRPILFDFDIYVRAATEIQRVFRGHKVRKSAYGYFSNVRGKVIFIQRHIRKFIKRMRAINQKYLSKVQEKKN